MSTCFGRSSQNTQEYVLASNGLSKGGENILKYDESVPFKAINDALAPMTDRLIAHAIDNVTGLETLYFTVEELETTIIKVPNGDCINWTLRVTMTDLDTNEVLMSYTEVIRATNHGITKFVDRLDGIGKQVLKEQNSMLR